MICSLIINGSLANATNEGSCETQLAACEQVIDAGNKYIIQLNKQLEQKNELALALEREVALLKQRADDVSPKWFERPSFVVPATIVATVLTVIAVRKAARD